MRVSDSLPFAIRATIQTAGDSVAMRQPVTAYDRAACTLLADALARLNVWATDTRETTRREAYGAARAALALCDAPGADASGSLNISRELARAVVACIECSVPRALAACGVARARAGLRDVNAA